MRSRACSAGSSAAACKVATPDWMAASAFPWAAFNSFGCWSGMFSPEYSKASIESRNLAAASRTASLALTAAWAETFSTLLMACVRSTPTVGGWGPRPYAEPGDDRRAATTVPAAQLLMRDALMNSHFPENWRVCGKGLACGNPTGAVKLERSGGCDRKNARQSSTDPGSGASSPRYASTGIAPPARATRLLSSSESVSARMSMRFHCGKGCFPDSLGRWGDKLRLLTLWIYLPQFTNTCSARTATRCRAPGYSCSNVPGSRIRARPCTRSRRGDSKSMNSMPTLAVPAILPSDRYIPLPSYTGKTSSPGPVMRTKPGAPPLYETVGLPL